MDKYIDLMMNLKVLDRIDGCGSKADDQRLRKLEKRVDKLVDKMDRQADTVEQLAQALNAIAAKL